MVTSCLEVGRRRAAHCPAVTALELAHSHHYPCKKHIFTSIIHSVSQQLLRQQPDSFSPGIKCSKQGFLCRREHRSSVSATLSFFIR